ncbi:putative entero membrane protein [Yersinia pseudotuberculosis]|uniref:Putative entero membrane protein n=2 Tax=Yersinia pseudotuberculosis TaxID=633 RepID=A0A380QEB9_YERPU|nr:putative entero membrane protein [Yersinia pseudotuberculosis]SUP86836.1 putative entero membrane protein [Yersinia pseudotuberculosis]
MRLPGAAMKAKSKKIICALLLLGSILLGYFFWLSLRPVEIVAVHKDGNFSAVLVRDFPVTDKGKINWWLENRDMLKAKYSIPKPASDGFYTVIFWDFGDGYKEEGKYDRLCFYNMKSSKNCIDKNSLMIIRNSQYNVMSFTVDSGIYQLKNGGIVKMKGE